ncbi:MAG: adenylate/guanylate cyclase domain-containing protein [Thermoleophilia bacterium]|nr:adenylate/guanylate cyclase domain-containing protein [Thermoleophilia bacterium]
MVETPSDTCVRVVLFDDMRGSTALRERLGRGGDQTFETLRREHDGIVREAVTRDGAGELIKSTGDGVIALFEKPSVAVARALEIQDRLRDHPHIHVRIGLDVGEVKLASMDGHTVDVFGRHADWAARAMTLADGGHVCVTRAVYTDAASWLDDDAVAWKAHGSYAVKPGDPELEVYEPYRPGATRPLRRLRGEKVADARPARRRRMPAASGGVSTVAVVRPWEAVARDGREFAQKGAGAMYWFRVPLGGVSYPEGFRSFLEPALENARITKVRFVLDGSHEAIRQVWDGLVLPLVDEWAARTGRELEVRREPDRGRVVLDAERRRTLAWVFVDLSREFTPCFKLLVEDLDSEEATESSAQIFLSTAARTVWLRDGTQHVIRIPDAVLRVRAAEHDALLHALNGVANQWDSLFPA